MIFLEIGEKFFFLKFIKVDMGTPFSYFVRIAHDFVKRISSWWPKSMGKWRTYDFFVTHQKCAILRFLLSSLKHWNRWANSNHIFFTCSWCFYEENESSMAQIHRKLTDLWFVEIEMLKIQFLSLSESCRVCTML